MTKDKAYLDPTILAFLLAKRAVFVTPARASIYPGLVQSLKELETKCVANGIDPTRLSLTLLERHERTQRRER